MMRLQDIKKVAVVGAGSMGHGCALVFADGGYQVTIQDLAVENLERAVRDIRSDMTFLVDRGLGRTHEIEPVMRRVSITDSLQEAVRNADFVLECVFEDMSIKQDLFRRIDELTSPSAVLATNTSVMRITEIAAKSERRERIIGTHWWNPPFLIPLVEVVQTEMTAPWTVKLAMDLHRAIGKHPVHCRKDVPGFVANRLQHALWREAVSIVEHGIADAATVDESLKFGPGMRLPVLAPLENADMIGLDLTLSIHNYVLKSLEDSHEPSPLLKAKVEKGELGFKSGGAGFRTWTAEEQRALRVRVQDFLARAAQQMRTDGTY